MATTESENRREIARLPTRPISLEDRYDPPANLFEIKTNLPVFRLKDCSVRRRYSDFEWLRKELERDSKIVVAPLPLKAWKRQMPAFLRRDDGIFEDDFIDERRKGLKQFINKVAGHPLAQNERSLDAFLQDPIIDHHKYVSGKYHNSWKIRIIYLFFFCILYWLQNKWLQIGITFVTVY